MRAKVLLFCDIYNFLCKKCVFICRYDKKVGGARTLNPNTEGREFSGQEVE